MIKRDDGLPMGGPFANLARPMYSTIGVGDAWAMRIAISGIQASPDVPIDDTSKAVLWWVQSQLSNLAPTPAMLKAGAKVLENYEANGLMLGEGERRAHEVFEAMWKAREGAE